MIPVALHLLRGVFVLAQIAAIAFGITLAMAVLFDETDRVLRFLRRRRARPDSGLRVLEPDELTRRARRRDQ